MYDMLLPTLSLYAIPSLYARNTLNEEKQDRHISLEKRLKYIVENMQVDRFMLLEYLVPVIDGCRAALNVSIDQAKSLEKMSESEFDEYMTTADNS